MDETFQALLIKINDNLTNMASALEGIEDSLDKLSACIIEERGKKSQTS